MSPFPINIKTDQSLDVSQTKGSDWTKPAQSSTNDSSDHYRDNNEEEMRNDDESEDELVIEEPDTSQDSENMKKENRSPELSTTASDIQGEFKI